MPVKSRVEPSPLPAAAKVAGTVTAYGLLFWSAFCVLFLVFALIYPLFR